MNRDDGDRGENCRAGAQWQKLAKGDFFIIPAGVPHWFTDIPPAGVSLMQLYLPKTN